VVLKDWGKKPIDFGPGSQIRFPHLGHHENTVIATSSPVTELLVRWSAGDADARDRLIPLVYSELRRIARRVLAGQRQNHTLQGTALVHEAYLRLVGANAIDWQDRVHFFSLAAQLMRRILVDHTRMRLAKKRGGENVTVVLDENMALSGERELDLLVLDDALNKLAAIDPRQSRVVELRFFAGLSIEDTSKALEISPATVKREWATAKLWLLSKMRQKA
jgi:RNA polymerase sigma factor (TIGR02999 family)